MEKKIVVRIWKGRKEGADHDYFCGQRLIMAGRLEDCWETVTAEYATEQSAMMALPE